MTSLKTDTVGRLRARAAEARQNAALEPEDSVRQSLLNDADLWERMASYEEKNPAPDYTAKW
jgi:hypothetical protein